MIGGFRILMVIWGDQGRVIGLYLTSAGCPVTPSQMLV